jgi:hypothetical protein
MVSCRRDAAYWHYELDGKSPGSLQRYEFRVIESVAGERVGFLIHPPIIWNPIISMFGYELKAGVSWLSVTPSVIRYLVKTGKSYAAETREFELAGYQFYLGADHPAYQVLQNRMPCISKPYAWYIRVADIPDFLKHIGPVLERRLLDSYLVGYSGNLKISLYRSAVKLSFDHGLLKDVESYQPVHNEDADVLFPGLTFLRVLFGYESFYTVENAFPDCLARSDQGRALMPVLFPQKYSNVWAIA